MAIPVRAVRNAVTIFRQYRGEKVETKTQIKRKRARLREHVQAEHREIQTIARTHAVAAMNKMAEIVRDSDHAASVIAAAQVIFDRAYGKANQTNITANIDANGKPSDVTSTELDARIAETLRRVEGLTGRASEEETGEGGAADICVSDRDPGNSSLH